LTRVRVSERTGRACLSNCNGNREVMSTVDGDDK